MKIWLNSDNSKIQSLSSYDSSKKHFNLNLVYADGKKKIHILLLDTVMQLVIAVISLIPKVDVLKDFIDSIHILFIMRVIYKYCLRRIVEYSLNFPIVEVRGIQIPFILSHLELIERKMLFVAIIHISYNFIKKLFLNNCRLNC